MIPWGIVSTARVYSNASVWATENRISFPNGSDQERSLDLKEASCQLPPSISQLDMFKGENFYTGQRVYSSTDDDVIGWPAEIRASSDLPPRNRLISERKSPPPQHRISRRNLIAAEVWGDLSTIRIFRTSAGLGLGESPGPPPKSLLSMSPSAPEPPQPAPVTALSLPPFQNPI